ncbi:hypothetical protein MD484_g1328, partial [Candolleomyces efflorescens]
MLRFPDTLACQMAVSIPQVAHLIEAAVKVEPALVSSESDSTLSLDTRLRRLVYEPFKAAVPFTASLAHPYLIVIDGLDECEDKDGIGEFLNTTFNFFDENPSIPLRILVTSRVERHIQPLLLDSRVKLLDLGNNTSRDDVRMFLHLVFEEARRTCPVIQAYIRRRGSWPKPSQMDALLNHIDGSFILAATLAKYIIHGIGPSDSHLTPIDRLPLAIKINPGLDGLYIQTLSRAQDRPYFHDIISTITILEEPLPISGIAELLNIQPYEVVHALVDLQAIVQVPGTDDIPVTFYHTSLRDFLTTESRSKQFFVPPSFHVRLLTHCLRCEMRVRRQYPKLDLEFGRQTVAVQYSLEYREAVHWKNGCNASGPTELATLVQLRREMLEMLPDHEEEGGCCDLGSALIALFHQSGMASHIEESISIYRDFLDCHPHPHPNRDRLLSNLGKAFQSLYLRSRSIPHLEAAVPMHRQALNLRPNPHPTRHESLHSLGECLFKLSLIRDSIAHAEEAGGLLREAIKLRPQPHPERHSSLHLLGKIHVTLFKKTTLVSHIEEAVPAFREAVSLRLHPHTERHSSLFSLGDSLISLFERTHSISLIEEAVPVLRESASLRPHPHADRHWSLNKLTLALFKSLDSTKPHSHLDLEEIIALEREELSLRLHPHPERPWTLGNLAYSLYTMFQSTGSAEHLDEAISLQREALSYQPGPPFPAAQVVEWHILCLKARYGLTQSISDLDEAITQARTLAFGEYPILPFRRDNRGWALKELQSLLQQRFDVTQNQEDLDDIENLREFEDIERVNDLLLTDGDNLHEDAEDCDNSDSGMDDISDDASMMSMSADGWEDDGEDCGDSDLDDSIDDGEDDESQMSTDS